MEFLRGFLALSVFRINKLLTACHKKNISIKSIHSQYVHFIDLAKPLTESEQLTLNQLL